MNNYVLGIKDTLASVVLQSLAAILNVTSKHNINANVSNVAANSTTFEVILSYNVAQSLTVKCNCSNYLQICANLTSYIALQTVYSHFHHRVIAFSRLNSTKLQIITLN